MGRVLGVRDLQTRGSDKGGQPQAPEVSDPLLARTYNGVLRQVGLSPSGAHNLFDSVASIPSKKYVGLRCTGLRLPLVESFRHCTRALNGCQIPLFRALIPLQLTLVSIDQRSSEKKKKKSKEKEKKER